MPAGFGGERNSQFTVSSSNLSEFWKLDDKERGWRKLHLQLKPLLALTGSTGSYRVPNPSQTKPFSKMEGNPTC